MESRAALTHPKNTQVPPPGKSTNRSDFRQLFSDETLRQNYAYISVISCNVAIWNCQSISSDHNYGDEKHARMRRTNARSRQAKDFLNHQILKWAENNGRGQFCAKTSLRRGVWEREVKFFWLINFTRDFFTFAVTVSNNCNDCSEQALPKKWTQSFPKLIRIKYPKIFSLFHGVAQFFGLSWVKYKYWELACARLSAERDKGRAFKHLQILQSAHLLKTVSGVKISNF